MTKTSLAHVRYNRTMSGDYRFEPIGGHPVLDLCNTRSWRLDEDRDIERIATPAEFARWYHVAVDRSDGDRLLECVAQAPAVAARDLRDIHALRATVTAWLDASIAGAGDPEAVRAFAEKWRDVLSRAHLSADLPPHWESADVVDIRSATDRLTLAAADLLQGRDITLLRRCHQPDCGWFFLDRTRNHSRRWCIAEDCGNLSRVRAYSARRKQARSSGSLA